MTKEDKIIELLEKIVEKLDNKAGGSGGYVTTTSYPRRCPTCGQIIPERSTVTFNTGNAT